MDNIEPEERIAIGELRERMQNVPKDEMYGDDKLLYRFLKARDFCLDDAETMLREHLKWRKRYDVKNASKYKLSEVFKKYFPVNMFGHDKEGCVLHYVPASKMDWVGLFSSSKREEFARYVIYYFEKALEDHKKYRETTGKTEDKHIYIYNMEKFPFAQATNKKVILNGIFALSLYANNYPEILKAAYIINASVYFYLLFSILKKFLPPTILNKIHIYTDDSFKEDFLKIIEAEELPAFLGGKRTDPDGNPLCLTFINHGESVPQKYYIHINKQSLANLPDVQRLMIPRANFHEICLEVKKINSYLEWEFETKNGDIGFGLFYENDVGNAVEIIPIQRINTYEYPETGFYKCDNVGKYIVVFDNTYSVIRKKDIFYKIKVKKESEMDSELKLPDY